MIDEIWAVPVERIKDYFRDKDANVTIIPLGERQIGSLKFPQTRVVITGENAEEEHRSFVLNFLSGGG